MLGVGGGCERDGAGSDGPEADVREARDARRKDGDEPEHVSALVAATRTVERLDVLCAAIRLAAVWTSGELIVGRGRRPARALRRSFALRPLRVRVREVTDRRASNR